MTFKIIISEQADMDLRAIYEYIAYNLQSPETASKQLNRLEKGIMSLSQMPERFRQYDNKSWQNYNVHIMPIDNYCIFYIPNITYSIVTILRVMYSRRNINTHLENSLIKEYR